MQAVERVLPVLEDIEGAGAERVVEAAGVMGAIGSAVGCSLDEAEALRTGLLDLRRRLLKQPAG